MRHVGIGALERSPQAVRLQLGERCARHRLGIGIEHENSRVTDCGLFCSWFDLHAASRRSSRRPPGLDRRPGNAGAAHGRVRQREALIEARARHQDELQRASRRRRCTSPASAKSHRSRDSPRRSRATIRAAGTARPIRKNHGLNASKHRERARRRALASERGEIRTPGPGPRSAANTTAAAAAASTSGTSAGNSAAAARNRPLPSAMPVAMIRGTISRRPPGRNALGLSQDHAPG